MSKLTKYFRITMEDVMWPTVTLTKNKEVLFEEVKEIKEESKEHPEIDAVRARQVMFDLNRIVNMLNSVIKNGEENENDKKD